MIGKITAELEIKLLVKRSFTAFLLTLNYAKKRTEIRGTFGVPFYQTLIHVKMLIYRPDNTQR